MQDIVYIQLQLGVKFGMLLRLCLPLILRVKSGTSPPPGGKQELGPGSDADGGAAYRWTGRTGC